MVAVPTGLQFLCQKEKYSAGLKDFPVTSGHIWSLEVDPKVWVNRSSDESDLSRYVAYWGGVPNGRGYIIMIYT